MGSYTRTDKQIDNYYEVDSINKSLPKQNFHLKILVSSIISFFLYLKLLSELINLSRVPSFFLFDGFSKPSFFISSKALNSGIPYSFSKNSILLSFFSISIFISSIVSPIVFIACSKTLL